MSAVLRAGKRLIGPAIAAVTLALAGCVSDGTTTGSVGGDRPSLFGSAGSAKAKAAPVAVSFEPIVGPSEAAVGLLAASLANHAAARQVPLVASGDPGAVYRVKGYLSAAPEGKDVAISYVWDVFDAAENRVNRISGTEIVPAGAAGGDPWSTLDATAANAIAGPTIESLAALGGPAG